MKCQMYRSRWRTHSVSSSAIGTLSSLFYVTSLIATVLSCTGPVGPQGPQGEAIREILLKSYNSGNNSELVEKIRIGNTGSGWDIGEVVFSIEIKDVKKGDVIVAIAEVEVTNDVGYNVAVPSELILTDAIDKKPGDSPAQEISEANGSNVTPDMHHGEFTKVGSIQSPQDAASMTVNFCVRAASTAAPLTAPFDFLTVNKDYGRLIVMVYSGGG